MLQTIVEDTRKAEIRLVISQERATILRRDVNHIRKYFIYIKNQIFLLLNIYLWTEERLALLNTDLDLKKNALASAFEETEEMTSRILINLEKKNGLCLRCLNKPLISLILEYIGGTKSSVSIVCKYWNVCSKELQTVGSKELKN